MRVTKLDREMETAREEARTLTEIKKSDGTFEVKISDEERLAIMLWANRTIRKTMRVPLGRAVEVQMRFHGRPNADEWARLRKFIDMLQEAWEQKDSET